MIVDAPFGTEHWLHGSYGVVGALSLRDYPLGGPAAHYVDFSWPIRILRLVYGTTADDFRNTIPPYQICA